MIGTAGSGEGAHILIKIIPGLIAVRILNVDPVMFTGNKIIFEIGPGIVGVRACAPLDDICAGIVVAVYIVLITYTVRCFAAGPRYGDRAVGLKLDIVYPQVARGGDSGGGGIGSNVVRALCPVLRTEVLGALRSAYGTVPFIGESCTESEEQDHGQNK